MSSTEIKISRLALAKGAGWTIAAFGASQSLRVLMNVVLTRLLAPELFGIMLIVNSVRTGAELVSDVGIGQNIIRNRNADKPDFYNTAWTLQLIRGLILWFASFFIAAPLAHLYQAPILVFVVPVAAILFVIGGLSSMSIFLLQRRLQLAKLNTFDVIVDVIGVAAHVILAYIYPTIWALVFGALSGSAARTIGSHFLMPDVRHKFYIVRKYAWQIFGFGKWIFVSSIVYFLSMNFDRLYLGTVIPLGLLGVYGIARSFSEILGMLALRLSSMVIFPLIASSSEMPRKRLRERLASIRLSFLLLGAVVISIFAATADLLIQFLFDQRYQAAGWMLPVLTIGAWFSVICSVNEATLVGFGKPLYGAVANSLKFGWLMIGLPLGVMKHGMLGAVIVASVSDLFRYFPLLIGQLRERFSFAVQDLSVTLVMFGLLGLWAWLRWALGFGTSFDDLPITGSMP